MDCSPCSPCYTSRSTRVLKAAVRPGRCVGYRVRLSTEVQRGLSRVRSLACCASQCDASSIKQAAIHGATVSRLQVIVGPALGFVHRRKRERERAGRSEETEGTGKDVETTTARAGERERWREGEDEGEKGSCVRRVIRERARVRASNTRLCSRREISLGFSSSLRTEPYRMKGSRQRSSTPSLSLSVKSASSWKWKLFCLLIDKHDACCTIEWCRGTSRTACAIRDFSVTSSRKEK